MERARVCQSRHRQQSLVPRELNGAERHGRGRLRRVDDGNAEGVLQRLSHVSHAGAAHDNGAGAVLVPERTADFDHFGQRSAAGRRLRHAHVERPFAGKPVRQSHLAQIADVAANRALRDGNHAERFGARHGRQHAAFGNAEYRPVGSFPAHMQAWIAVAGDDESRRAVVAFDQPPQRHYHTIGIGLALDSVRSLGKGRADDLRPIGEIERFEGFLQSPGHVEVGVGVDHEDARAGHVGSLQ